MFAVEYPPGSAPKSTLPGTWILTRRHSVQSSLIAAGQALRFTRERRRFAHWTHAALVVGEQGELVEALDTGVKRTDLSRYHGIEFLVVQRPDGASPREVLHALAFAEAVAKHHERYSWAEDVSLGVELLTGSHLVLVSTDAMICSQLVAEALERMGAIFPRDASIMRPADLAEWAGL